MKNTFPQYQYYIVNTLKTLYVKTFMSRHVNDLYF